MTLGGSTWFPWSRFFWRRGVALRANAGANGTMRNLADEPSAEGRVSL
jgi:hypothetical protein